MHLPLPPYRAALEGEPPPEPAIAASLRVFELIRDPYGSLCGAGDGFAAYSAARMLPPPRRLPMPPVTVRGVPCPALQELSDLAWRRLRGPLAPRFDEPDEDLFGPEDGGAYLPTGAVSWREAIPALGLDREMDELEAELLLHCPPPSSLAVTASTLPLQSEEEAVAALQTRWGSGAPPRGFEEEAVAGVTAPAFRPGSAPLPGGSGRMPVDGLVEYGSEPTAGWQQQDEPFVPPLPLEDVDEPMYAPAAPRHDT